MTDTPHLPADAPSPAPRPADRPLVTFALFAFNQEAYIREAVEGAFAQTYQPLEIILSDDCSSDRTFQIMQEMAEAYRGPHRVILNRSAQNQGFGAHINKVVGLCNSEWLIVAAGDDISLPDRAASIARLVHSSAGKWTLVHSAAIKITESSKEVGVQQSRWLHALTDLDLTVRSKAYALGATVAWHRSLFTKFNPLPNNLMYEDQVFQVRALLLGAIGYIEKPLVKHRIGGVTGEYSRLNLHAKIFGTSNERWIVARRQQREDMIQFNANPAALGAVEADLALRSFRHDLLHSPSMLAKVRRAGAFAVQEKQPVQAVRHLILSVFPNLSERLFDVLMSLKKIREIQDSPKP